MEQETKAERFKRVAERRVNNILNNIRLLANCSNSRSYTWTDQQLNQIWNIIDRELKSAKESFKNTKKKKFRLKS
ncbi:MAG: hypothetical protein H8D67_20360 [Deltaproteobacteria bacterium]|nr:hypothetical protein [Deltaproteobacteria bacterium]